MPTLYPLLMTLWRSPGTREYPASRRFEGFNETQFGHNLEGRQVIFLDTARDRLYGHSARATVPAEGSSQLLLLSQPPKASRAFEGSFFTTPRRGGTSGRAHGSLEAIPLERFRTLRFEVRVLDIYV